MLNQTACAGHDQAYPLRGLGLALENTGDEHAWRYSALSMASFWAVACSRRVAPTSDTDTAWAYAQRPGYCYNTLSPLPITSAVQPPEAKFSAYSSIPQTSSVRGCLTYYRAAVLCQKLKDSSAAIFRVNLRHSYLHTRRARQCTPAIPIGYIAGPSFWQLRLTSSTSTRRTWLGEAGEKTAQCRHRLSIQSSRHTLVVSVL
jgi:hypothetical protein